MCCGATEDIQPCLRLRTIKQGSSKGHPGIEPPHWCNHYSPAGLGWQDLADLLHELALVWEGHTQLCLGLSPGSVLGDRSCGARGHRTWPRTETRLAAHTAGTPPAGLSLRPQLVRLSSTWLPGAQLPGARSGSSVLGNGRVLRATDPFLQVKSEPTGYCCKGE